MVFICRSAIVTFSTFVSALAGIFVQWLLPASYIVESMSMIGSVVGLVAMLLSVVVGLLVWTSHGLFNAHQADLEALGRSIARLEFRLRRLGPDGASARAVLRDQILRIRARFWLNDAGAIRRVIAYDDLEADVHAISAALAMIHPTDEEKRRVLEMAAEHFGNIVETQLTMIRSLANRVPSLLLDVVLGWACALFFGYGLLSGINALTVSMAMLGSAAVASAIFLILELADPYSGLFRMPSTGIDQLLNALPAEEPSLFDGRQLDGRAS
jgi:hypothetical protein